jgi:hypothetical protein
LPKGLGFQGQQQKMTGAGNRLHRQALRFSGCGLEYFLKTTPLGLTGVNNQKIFLDLKKYFFEAQHAGAFSKFKIECLCKQTALKTMGKIWIKMQSHGSNG